MNSSAFFSKIGLGGTTPKVDVHGLTGAARKKAEASLQKRGFIELLGMKTERLVLIMPAAALIAVLAAASEFSKLREEQAYFESEQMQAMPVLSVDWVNAQDLANRIKAMESAYPNIQIGLQGDNVAIRAKDVEEWPSWRGAIIELVAMNPDMSFKIDTMCAGSNCSGTALAITLIPRLKSLTVREMKAPEEVQAAVSEE